MPTVQHLLELATECHDRARVESNPLTKAQFKVMGDDYWRQAEELKGAASDGRTIETTLSRH